MLVSDNDDEIGLYTHPEQIPFKHGLSHEAIHWVPVGSKLHPLPAHWQTSGATQTPFRQPLVEKSTRKFETFWWETNNYLEQCGWQTPSIFVYPLWQLQISGDTQSPFAQPLLQAAPQKPEDENE